MSITAVPAVTVRVLLFASYADKLGFNSIDLTIEAPATMGDVLERLRRLPGGGRLPPKPLCAVNLAHVKTDAPLSEGDELAILPPLAGG
jgi:molybdopterin converting factor small subunit